MEEKIKAENIVPAFAMPHEKIEETSKNFTSLLVTSYENIPEFAAPELERLYSSIFSSLALFKIYECALDKTHAYVVRKNGEIVTLLLFRIEGRKAKVLNEVIDLRNDEIQRFASNIFAKYRGISIISFHAIDTEISSLSYPCQIHDCLEDMVLALPATEQEYLSSLGKNTRRNLKRYGERLLRTFPSFEFKSYEKGDIRPEDIREIVSLNQARMAGKNKKSIIDAAETDRIISLTRSHGLIGIARINGVICAGTISYQVGDNYYLSVLAHAPDYDEYWVGILCCYQTIQECIRRGGKKFHFLWGRYEYKSLLLAQRRDLNHVEIYRSWSSLSMNLHSFLKTFGAGKLRQGRLMLHDLKHRKQSGLVKHTFKTFLHRVTMARPSK